MPSLHRRSLLATPIGSGPSVCQGEYADRKRSLGRQRGPERNKRGAVGRHITPSTVGEMVFMPKILRRLRSLTPDATVRSVTLPPCDDLKQHWHRKFHNDAKVKWLRDLVATLFTDESDEWRDQT